jgi:hypothetical protein
MELLCSEGGIELLYYFFNILDGGFITGVSHLEEHIID